MRNVVSVRVQLVVQSLLKRVLENTHNIGSISCGDEFKRAPNLFDKDILAFDCVLIQIDLVCNAQNGNVRAVNAKLLVPVLQVLVGDLAIYIEDHDAHVRSKVVRAVQLIE